MSKGGTRQGAGRKPGSPNKGKKLDGRNVVKQVRWTEEEWTAVVTAADKHQMSPSQFIRSRVITADRREYIGHFDCLKFSNRTDIIPANALCYAEWDDSR